MNSLILPFGNCCTRTKTPRSDTDPPNLWAYRKDPNPPDQAAVSQLEPLAAPRHHYLRGIGSYVWLIVWLGLIGIAGYALGPIFHDRWHLLALALPLAAGLADWRESVLNYAVTLEPDGLRAERRLAAMDFYLFCRLFFIGLCLTGFVVIIVWVSPWLIRIGPPLPWLFWLIGLDLLMMQFGISAGWSAAPMADAGFGSAVQLQRAKTPAAVKGLLDGWTAGHLGEEGRRLLAPVARTLWRDLLGFILSYSILLFVGTWILLSLLDNPPDDERPWMLLSTTFWTWGAAASLAIACALADCIEDICHLKYIKLFPAAPGRGRVALAVTATSLSTFFLVWVLWPPVGRPPGFSGRKSSWYFGASPAVAITQPAALRWPWWYSPSCFSIRECEIGSRKPSFARAPIQHGSNRHDPHLCA